MAEFVEWEDRFSVGIKEINDQHKKLIALTNTLFEACRQGSESAGEAFAPALKEAVDYVKTHFAFEEGLMNRFAYPQISEHKKEHESFVMKIIEEAQAFKEGRRFVPNHFARFLRDWLLEHIAIQDQKLGRYLKTQIQKP